MLPNLLLRFRGPLVFLVHLALIPLGYWLAYCLRFDYPLPAQYAEQFAATVLVLIPIRLLSFRLFGLYQGWWRHAGMRDLVDLVRGVTLSSIAFLAVLYFTQLGAGLPRLVLVLDWLLALALFGGLRFAVRGYRETRQAARNGDRRAPAALLVGAGEGAERLLRQVHQGGASFRPVGLVDDDPAKQGMRLHRVPVLGATDRIPELVKQLRVKLIVIAIPSASREEMKKIVDRCMAAEVEFKIVPSLQELLDGSARLSQLRDVQVEDLLGRPSVDLDLGPIRRGIEGRCVMVTGGAGSIGSELARQIAGMNPRKLVLVEQAESPLYFVDLELRRNHPELEIVPLVADVTDRARIRRIFAKHRPDHVYHAAAYKHVPLMEANVVEAVRNNVFGTFVVAEAAADHGATEFVLISTDKAVRPSSVMGATKRVAERLVLGWPALKASGTDFRAVRFGNVLGSDGSVIPLFRKQLAAGGPLTVTHPEVTRYFMTIPEAVQLVLQAAAIPEAAGRITMLEMGEPVRIVELAENLLKLSGIEPYTEMPIVFSGLRPGEKLYEELMTEVEESVPTSVEKIRVVETDETDAVLLQKGMDRLAAAAEIGDVDELVCGVCAFVPECVSPLKELRAESLRRIGKVARMLPLPNT